MGGNSLIPLELCDIEALPVKSKMIVSGVSG